MSEYLLGKYRPIVDALLSAHKLTVDGITRDMLANSIMHARELARSSKQREHSPLPVARKALGHARKLLQYAQTPPRRKDSVPGRCAKLRAALLDGPSLPVVLGIRLASSTTTFNIGEFLGSLEVCNIDEGSMATLVHTLEAITASPSHWQAVGRPWGLAKPIVRGGCIAWRLAGKPKLGYRWNEGTGRLTGSLPNFLRDLLKCCAGTHPLIAKREQRRNSTQADTVTRSTPKKCRAVKRSRPQGDGLFLSDASLKLAIIACKKDAVIQRHLRKNRGHI